MSAMGTIGRALLVVGLLARFAAAEEPPLVRMLAPGFKVRELPVKLPNLNSIRYGPDGRLYAAGYDGRIHVLSDTDGDGLEDHAELYWSKGGLRTPMAMMWGKEGLFVLSNGKLSLLRDTDGDEKADSEQVVCSGWPTDDGTTGGGVDAVGLARDAEGNFYFGLGCADYSNAYRVKDGVSHYDVKSQRGTIQKLSADFKTRETLCSGVRFSIGLAFNKAGDLFDTDQEGETWLPGGNPLDELNFIRPSRHYAFPPQNPKYLPNLIDEPPITGFGPQHQSACGLIFNEKTEAHPAWGPAWWEDQALVAGFSRGKIWRVQLVKTPEGYVGRHTLIAALRMLTLDLAIAPKGGLVVACHSGPPDWGTGPAGEGKLFKIDYVDAAAPQPVLAYAAGPTEVRVEFDRPVEPSTRIDAADVRVDFGEYVRAGDAYENLKPPYAAVEAQSRAYRGQLRVAETRWSDDHRTLIVTTDPHPMQTHYAIGFPFEKGRIELDYDLTGVDAEWTADDAKTPAWTGWLPHPDLTVGLSLLRNVADGEKLSQLLRKKGDLNLRTSFRTLEPGFTVGIHGGLVTTNDMRFELRLFADRKSNHAYATSTNGAGTLATLIHTGGVAAVSHAWRVGDDRANENPIPLAWSYPEWAPRQLPSAPPPAKLPPEWAGGDVKRGEAVFLSKEANCVACHVFRGKGGKIGPDLSNLPQRDAASILRDITEPNAAINPDHVAYIAEMKDGRTLVGVVHSDGSERLRLADATGAETVLARDQIKRLRASPISIMPDGLAQALGHEKLRDLLAYLITEAPGEAAKSEENRMPPPRSRVEVQKALDWIPNDKQSSRPLRIVLVAGPKDHGPGEHDYPAWQKRWEPLLAKLPNVTIETAFGKPQAKQWESADLMVVFCWGPQLWDAETFKQVDALMARGGGLVLLHSAVIPAKPEEADALAERIGLAFPTNIKYRHGPLDLKFSKSADDVFGGGLPPLHFVDESYWPAVGDLGKVKVLATTIEEGEPRPMAWTVVHGKGRVFATILGHYSWTFDDPLARLMMLRGMAWAANEPAGRFNAAVTDGVEMKE